jgi:hypothetical protein
MAVRKYRINYGSHWIPNPEYKLDEKGTPIGEVLSHLEVSAPGIIELDEARAEQMTKAFFGQPAKLSLVSDSAGVPEIKSDSPQPPPLSPISAPAAAQTAHTIAAKEAPKHTGVAGIAGKA